MSLDHPPRRLARPPHGHRKGLCRWCSGAVKPPRQSWCSEACVEQYSIQSDPSFVRRRLLARDKGVCAACGFDCAALQRELRDLRWSHDGGDHAVALRKAALGIPAHRTTFWDADHIVPVVEGGGLCGLDGYRTLCWKCHQQVTSELRARMAREDP
jgi:5-methylcytosine-specific restriction protein A